MTRQPVYKITSLVISFHRHSIPVPTAVVPLARRGTELWLWSAASHPYALSASVSCRMAPSLAGSCSASPPRPRSLSEKRPLGMPRTWQQKTGSALESTQRTVISHHGNCQTSGFTHLPAAYRHHKRTIAEKLFQLQRQGNEQTDTITSTDLFSVRFFTFVRPKS